MRQIERLEEQERVMKGYDKSARDKTPGVNRQMLGTYGK